METGKKMCANISVADKIVVIYQDTPVQLLKTDRMIQEILCSYYI